MLSKIAFGERIRRVTLKVAGITHQVNAAPAQLLDACLYTTSDLPLTVHTSFLHSLLHILVHFQYIVITIYQFI